MDRLEKVRDVVSNDHRLTETSLKILIEHFSNDKTSELLSVMCDMISQIDGKWYALYKITVIIKYLFDKNPREVSGFLSKQIDILKSLKNYTYVDNFQVDQGANVRINIEQLLDFIGNENKFEDCPRTQASIWSINDNLNRTIDRLLQTLDSVNRIDSKKILENLRSDIARLNKYLPGPLTLEKYTSLDENPEIDGTIYGKIVEKIVDRFDDNFPMINNKIDPIIEHFIVVDGSTFFMFHESLVVLADALKRSSNPRIMNSLVTILEKLITSQSILSATMEICKSNAKNAIEREEMESKWQITLQIIVSLPNRIANKLSGKIPNFFLPETYAKIMSFHIARSVSFLNSNLKKFVIEPELRIISMLISKLVVTLGSKKFEPLIDIISEWCRENLENIRYTINKILTNVDRSAVEPMAVLFLKRNDYVLEDLENLLKNPHWRHVFTKKIPFMSCYENENVAKNLIAYLSHSSKDERILPDLIAKLLDIWGDRSALNHTSLEQHVYITNLIIRSLIETKGTLMIDEKNEIRRLLFSGISAHLESTQSELRGIGMITGEMAIEILSDSKDEPRLIYDYEGIGEKTREIVEKLRNLANIKEEMKNSDVRDENLYVGKILFENLIERKIYELGIDSGILSNASMETSNFVKIKQTFDENKIDDNRPTIFQVEVQDPDENLDSDDDLVPYDMSNDTPISEKLRPTYLRDLRDNLLNSHSNKDPDIFAESMKISEELIFSQLPNDDSSFAIELLEILVTLRENSYMENFELLKYNACIAIVMVFPKESAKYLCQEFHKKINEYSIKDRLFILNILGESAKRLSKIETKLNTDDDTTRSINREKKIIPKKISLAIDTSNIKKYETLYDDDFELLTNFNEKTHDWQEIVNKRIESNTRRFAHPAKLSPTTMNKFNDVASSFFYPLLYGFRREGTSMYNTPKTFEDQENIILVNYLKTLSKIMMAAENCVIVPKIGKEIMELAWTLRYHNQAKVRLCVIENIASVVITMPNEGLTGDLMDLIFEFRAWLSDVSDDGIRGDPDSQCRNLGKNVVALIDSIFRSTLREC